MSLVQIYKDKNTTDSDRQALIDFLSIRYPDVLCIKIRQLSESDAHYCNRWIKRIKEIVNRGETGPK